MGLGRCPARLWGAGWDRLFSWPCQRDLAALLSPGTLYRAGQHPLPCPDPPSTTAVPMGTGTARVPAQLRLAAALGTPPRGAPTP